MADRLPASGIQRIVADLIGDTLRLPVAETADLTAVRVLSPQDVGVDSLHLLELATRVSELFRLHEIGTEDNLLRRRSIGDWTHAVRATLAHPVHAGLSLQTSGSTGAPNAHQHDWPDLDQEIEVLAELFAGRQRVVATVSPRHIYGLLFTVMLPHRLGIEVVDARPDGPAGVGPILRPGDLLVSFPLFLDHLRRVVGQPPADVLAVTSTGPCPQETSEGLLDAGFAGVIEIYGSTETGGIGWRPRPDHPFRCFPHWSLVGPSLLHKISPDGRKITVAPPDRLTVVDGGFLVGGRHDAMVQVGGVNVSPAGVAERIRGHPDVADCIVRLMAPDEGGRLKAFVVPTESSSATIRTTLRRWLLDSLSAAERPASLTFGREVPRDQQGKAVDWHPARD